MYKLLERRAGANYFVDDTYHTSRLDFQVDVVAFVNHLSGLSNIHDTIRFEGICWPQLILPLQANKEKRGTIFKRAESYVKEYRDAEREKIRLARASRQEGSFYVPDEPKLVFVTRIKG